jgi:hypothetical protein
MKATKNSSHDRRLSDRGPTPAQSPHETEMLFVLCPQFLKSGFEILPDIRHGLFLLSTLQFNIYNIPFISHLYTHFCTALGK